MRSLGTGSGTGLVVANMIGAGVFLSAGFMAQNLTAGEILVAWVIGAIIALSGARAYAAVAEAVPRSGGEYRYLSTLLHPAVGYVAGWASLLLGFSAPIAIDAYAAGAFLKTLWSGADPLITGVVVLAALTVAHAVGMRWSKRTQNTLVAVKVILIVGFIVVGSALGSRTWPAWRPPQPDNSIASFAGSLFYIAFAFSGWNAAAYAAEDFREPARQVPRSMLIGCSLVALLYLLVNWIIVANVTPQQAQVVFDYESKRLTLGHLVARQIIGPAGGAAMSVLALVAFVSAMSAMIMAGARVYAAMAADGLLPALLRRDPARTPAAAVVLQGSVALVILLTHRLQTILQTAGAILSFFTAAVCIALIVATFRGAISRPPAVALLGAAIHAAAAGLMLYFGFRQATGALLWIAVCGVLAVGLYYGTLLASRARPRL